MLGEISSERWSIDQAPWTLDGYSREAARPVIVTLDDRVVHPWTLNA